MMTTRTKLLPQFGVAVFNADRVLYTFSECSLELTPVTGELFHQVVLALTCCDRRLAQVIRVALADLRGAELQLVDLALHHGEFYSPRFAFDIELSLKAALLRASDGLMGLKLIQLRQCNAKILVLEFCADGVVLHRHCGPVQHMVHT